MILNAFMILEYYVFLCNVTVIIYLHYKNVLLVPVAARSKA